MAAIFHRAKARCYHPIGEQHSVLSTRYSGTRHWLSHPTLVLLPHQSPDAKISQPFRMKTISKSALGLLLTVAVVPCLAQRPLHVSHPYHPPAQLKTPREQTARAQRTEVARNRVPEQDRQATTGKNRK